MSMTYWIVLWVVMGLAFGLAWIFIVKGCEAMDSRHPDATESTD